MRERSGNQKRSVLSQRQLHVAASLLLIGGVMLTGSLCPAHAESLFRAGISYQTSQPYTPRSLFSLPRPATIGDTVTIDINHFAQAIVENTGTLNHQQVIEENNTQIFNNIIKKLTGISQLFPRIDGSNNLHQVNSRAINRRNYQFRDSVSCQVVQVLPNGHLLVQGKKTVSANQETQTLYISGIVNPYFLNAQNRINSDQVANLEMHVAGKGQITRQQGDGLLGKYFQLFN